jgi:hypothetical protein
MSCDLRLVCLRRTVSTRLLAPSYPLARVPRLTLGASAKRAMSLLLSLSAPFSWKKCSLEEISQVLPSSSHPAKHSSTANLPFSTALMGQIPLFCPRVKFVAAGFEGCKRRGVQLSAFFQPHSKTASISHLKHTSALSKFMQHIKSSKNMSSWCSYDLLRPPALLFCPPHSLLPPECDATTAFHPSIHPVIESTLQAARLCHLGAHPTYSGHLLRPGVRMGYEVTSLACIKAQATMHR